MDSERRRAPRYPIIADAEVTEIASETRLSAKTSDLSEGGCCLDMLNPSPESTEIVVRISRSDTTFTPRGKAISLFHTTRTGVILTSVQAYQPTIMQQ